MKKRIVLFFLVIIILVISLSVSVFADGGSAVITVDTSAFAGEAVTIGDELVIPVRITNNPGFASYVLQVSWDETAFKACDPLYTEGEVVSGSFLGGDRAVCFSSRNAKGDGVLFSLHLIARKACESSEISLVMSEGVSMCNAKEEDISMSFVSGTITVEGAWAPEKESGGDEQKPSEHEQKPAENEQQETVGEEKPGNSEQKAAEGKEKSDKGAEEQGKDKQQEAVDMQRKDEGAQNPTESKTDPKETAEAAEKSDRKSEKAIEKKELLPTEEASERIVSEKNHEASEDKEDLAHSDFSETAVISNEEDLAPEKEEKGVFLIVFAVVFVLVVICGSFIWKKKR